MSAAADVVKVPALLARLRSQDPGRPRVTWYGADGERVELSARVLQNWVAKTANLLLEECEVEVATPVHLALPAHWRSVVWVLAVAAAGGELVGDPAQADVVVVADGAPVPPGAGTGTGTGAPGTGQLVVQALPALAFRAQAVPAGALDAAAVVAGYGDDVPVVPGAPGVRVRSGALPGSAGRRVLLDASGADAGGGLDTVVQAVVEALAGGGSAVLLGPGAPDADRVAAQEGTA